MASRCVNNFGVSPESRIDCQMFSSYGWLSSTASFNEELPDIGAPKSPGAGNTAVACIEKNEESDLGASTEELVDFEFRVEDPVGILPADELFYEGKLVHPRLQLSVVRRPSTASEASTFEISSPESHIVRRRNEISSTDSYLFSPKAPRCSCRWKDILGLKKLYQNPKKQELMHKTSSYDSSTNAQKYLKHFLHRNPKSSLSSSLDLSLSIPLLKDMESESSSDDLPRFSMDSKKPKPARIGCHKTTTNNTNPPRLRVPKSQALPAENPGSMRAGRRAIRRETETMIRGVSVDSPRMSSSGKIVFHGIERSSSSPSSLYGGGSKYSNRHGGREGSYYANVRVSPVINVPICSLRGYSLKSGGRNGASKLNTSRMNCIDRTD